MKNLGLKNASPFRLAAGAALFGLVWAATFTAAPAAAQGTAEQQQACTPDVFRLCNEFIPDVAKITACMVRKRALASPACRAATATPHVKKRIVHHHQT